MPATATVTLFPVAALPALREAAEQRQPGAAQGTLRRTVAQHGRPVAAYGWAGYVLATLLACLEELRAITLDSDLDDLALGLAEKQNASFIFLTPEHRRWLPELEPARFTEQELCAYFNDFNECEEPDSGRPMLEGVGFLQRAIAAVEPDTVGLLVIG
ncbi:MAG: hypothetical protein QM767_14525 [Anaeromyxobacter sp.]